MNSESFLLGAENENDEADRESYWKEEWIDKFLGSL